jgi:hypothetical protein
MVTVILYRVLGLQGIDARSGYIKLMEYIIKYLGVGQKYKYPKISAVNLTIVKYSDIYIYI